MSLVIALTMKKTVQKNPVFAKKILTFCMRQWNAVLFTIKWINNNILTKLEVLCLRQLWMYNFSLSLIDIFRFEREKNLLKYFWKISNSLKIKKNIFVKEKKLNLWIFLTKAMSLVMVALTMKKQCKKIKCLQKKNTNILYAAVKRCTFHDQVDQY